MSESLVEIGQFVCLLILAGCGLALVERSRRLEVRCDDVTQLARETNAWVSHNHSTLAHTVAALRAEDNLSEDSTDKLLTLLQMSQQRYTEGI